MLRYLNQVAFSAYGRIQKGPMPEGGTCSTITNKDVTAFSSCSGPVFLTIESGVCALCVSSDSNVQAFLLDKAVELRPGVPFALAAVGGPCTITQFTRGAYQSFPYTPRFSPTHHNPQITIHEIITFFYQEKEFGLRNLPEKHDFYELTYVDSGRIKNTIDGRDVTAQQGDLLFFFPGQTHLQTAEEKSASFITISFAMTLAHAELLKNRVFHADGVIRALYSRILSEYESFDRYSPDMLVGYLHEIILRLMRYRTGITPPIALSPANGTHGTEARSTFRLRSAVTNPLVHSALDYIDTHIEKKLSLSDVAEALKLNPSYISRLFKAQTGNTVTDYIRIQKLAKAKKLLKAGGYTVTEISELFGFSSIHYFSACFKKQYGIAPGSYAQMLRD